MTTNQNTETTITETTEVTGGGYQITIQHSRCENCNGCISRAKAAKPGVDIRWGHDATGRSVCLLPANVTKMATPK